MKTILWFEGTAISVCFNVHPTDEALWGFGYVLLERMGGYVI